MLVLSSLEAEARASDEVGKDSVQVTPSTLQATIDEAAKAFAARQFAQARILFQRSAKQATDPETKRELFFNAGVCAFEQADYYAAEQHFLQAAAIAPADAAGRFYVHAGLAAVRLGDVDRASVHLSRANEATQTKLAEELATSIERRRNETARQARENTINSYLQKSEQARRDSDWKAEREALRQALQLAPELVDLNVAIGASLAQSGDYVAAERTLTEALGLPLGQKAQTVALASLDALYPVPPSGVRVGLGLSSGFDTNASASPAAERRGVFTQGGDSLDPTRSRVSSILTKADLNVAYSWRWARQWALVPALRVQAAWFARQAVRRLSLTTTDLGLALYHAPSVATQLSAGIGSTLLVLDWLPKTAFLSEVYAEVGGLFRLSPAWSTLFSLRAAPAQGYGQHKDLSGGSLALQLGGQWTTSFVNTTLLLSGFASRAGKQNIPASETAVPACSPESLERPILCDRAHFEVPLSYFKPEIALNVQVTPWKPLMLSFAVRAFSRRFGEPSVVRVEPNDVVLAASEKLRRDRGWEFGVGAEVFPTATRTWSLFTQHTLLVHRSNLAPDAQDQDHRFDYEDHNYNKYVAQLGVRANFW
jgi:Tfp pilus assembly protein PilF